MANEYWQMTLRELMGESFQPTKSMIHFGSWGFECQICAMPVGIYRPEDGGLVFRRDVCPNGHKVDWSQIREAKVKNGRIYK